MCSFGKRYYRSVYEMRHQYKIMTVRSEMGLIILYKTDNREAQLKDGLVVHSIY